MNVIERHHVEPEVTIRLTMTEVNIIRGALYHSDLPTVQDSATATKEQVLDLTAAFITLYQGL
jgi:hypothetical protein